MSALSSLLVRDRVVNVRTIEDALQRQVISGGDLETALLEMLAVPEDTLAAYRAALVGGLAATRAELTRADAAAIALLPAEVALRHRLVPLRKEGARVVVAAAEQPAADSLGELSFLLGAQLDVRITTPFRLQWALALRYGAELSPRLRRLSDKLEQRDPGVVPRVAPLVAARRPSVTPGSATPAASRAEASTPVVRPSAPTLAAARPSEERVSASEVTGPLSDPGEATPAGVAAPEAPTRAKDAAPDAAPAAVDAAIEAPEPPVEAATEGAVAALETTRQEPERPNAETVSVHDAPTVETPIGMIADAVSGATLAGLPVPVSDPRSQAPAPAGSRPPSQPAPAGAARPVAVSRVVPVRRVDDPRGDAPTGDTIKSTFAAASDRDGVLAAAFALARRLLDYCALFVVQDEVAEGRDAAGPGADRDAVTAVAIPLDAPGSLADVRTSATIYIGPPRDDATDEVLQKQLGRLGASPILVLPVHIRGRMVLAIYGDRSGSPIGPEVRDVAEQIAHEAADALTRIILLKKRESSRAPPPPGGSQSALGIDGSPRVPVIAVSAEEHDTERPPPAFGDEHTEPSLAAPRMPTDLDTDLHDTETDIQVVALSDEAAAALEAEEHGALGDGAYKLVRETSEEVVYRRSPSNRAGRTERGRTPLPPRSPEARGPTPAGGYSMTNRRGDLVSADRVGVAETPHEPTPPRTSIPRMDRDEPSVIVDMGGNVAELVAALERPGADVEAGIAALLGLGEAALPELVQRFPGDKDLPDPRRGLPRTDDLGPIPRAIVAFRDRAVSYLPSLLSRPDPLHRFCAIATAAEVLHPSLVTPLSERLLDADEHVRAAAVDVLRMTSRHPEHERALAYIRAVAGDDLAEPARRSHALSAVGQLRDTAGLDVLVRSVGSHEAIVAEAARKALVMLTRQDFGTNRRKWIAWADKHRTGHRIEWLIDALLHETPDVRREASEELKRLTQEYFGYHFNQPAKERERAHRRYVLWWQDDGRRRFGAMR